MLSFAQIQEELDLEYFLDRESIAFKETRGSSGLQLNLKDCPNCGDSRWRTYFGIDSGRGNCFVCNQYFDKISFIKSTLGPAASWRDAIGQCEEILKDQGYKPKRQAMVQTNHNDVKLPASEPLPFPDGRNLEYLLQRGFDNEICKYFNLRYCQYGWWIFKDETGTTQTQNFENRIIIPVYDLDGTLKTFQGRDLSGLSSRKYLFPMELPGTGRYLLNGHNVIACKHVVMGEGAFDVAAIKVALDEDPELRDVVPVGSFGKHLSYGSPTGDDQLGRFLQLRDRGVETVTIMWDGEVAAFNSALEAGKLLARVGLQVRIAVLPAEKDPNEVPASVVRDAFRSAITWTPQEHIRLRLRNPYGRADK